MQNGKHRRNLQNNNHRNARHEFGVSGFVPDGKHSQQHGNRAAKGGHKKQGSLFHAPIPLLCGSFIVQGENNCNQADNAEIDG
jgi:hypothetical protein